MMRRRILVLVILVFVATINSFPVCSWSTPTLENVSVATSPMTATAKGQLPITPAKADRLSSLGPQLLDERGSQTLSSLESLPADADDGRLLLATQTRWWMINRWSLPLRMSGRFIAVGNTIQGLASSDMVAAIPLNVAYGTTTDFVWFQFGIRFDSGQATPVMDLENNIWHTGMGDMEYNHNFITNPSYVVDHEYSFSLTTSGVSTVTFTLTDTTSKISKSLPFTVPSTNLLIDPEGPPGHTAFSPASAAEGVTSNSVLTNVPFFQFRIEDNIQAFVYSEPVEPVGGQPPEGVLTDQISTGVSGIWYWEILKPGALPVPQINVGSVSYPPSVGVGQAAIINVPVTNNGGPATWQSIAVSFPVGQSVNAPTIVQTDLSNAHIFNSGETVHSSYSLSSKVLEQYLIEGTTNWETGASHYLKISVTPTLAGTFVFYIKSVAAAAAWACNWDPKSGDMDQQGEFVRTYTISVGVNPSSIFVGVDPSQIVLGSGTEISGTISSPFSGDLSGIVYLQYNTGAGWTNIGNTQASSSGTYSYWWTPSTTGSFNIRSYWNGNSNYGQATSTSVGLTVDSGSGSLRDHTMCKGVTPDPYDPITRTNTFYTDDLAAFSWVDIVGPIYGSHQIHWDWFDPDGWNWYEDGYNIPDPGPGYYYPWYRAWDPMSIDGYQSWYATRLRRPFQTKVYYDGTLMLTETWQVVKHDSSIGISLSQTSTTYGQSVTVSSQISPSFSDWTTTLQYSTDGANWNTVASGTPSNGYYSSIWMPPSADAYYLRAAWSGNLNYYYAVSSVQSLTVERATTSLATILSSPSISHGDTLTITAALSPPIVGKILTVQFSLDGSTWDYLDSGTTDSAGEYSLEWSPDLGEYYLRSSWTGDQNFQGSTSPSVTLTVVLGAVYIKADGSIDPPFVPIQRDENVYTFTGNIYAPIVIERDNIVLDGAGYNLQGNGGQGSGNGIELANRSSVVVRNIRITDWHTGILCWQGSVGNTITGNTVANNYAHGVAVSWSSDNSISNNTIRSNYWGIYLYASSWNTLTSNDIANSGQASIYLHDSSNGNTISGNTLGRSNYCNVRITQSANNLIYHNNLIDNSYQVSSYDSANVWDNGYPSGGNYWRDYTGIDANNDGIGDEPYIIEADNIDRYPLMDPWHTRWTVDDDGPADFHTIQEAINTAKGGDKIYVRTGIYYENVVVNKTLTLTGESMGETIIDAGGSFVQCVLVTQANSVNITGFTIQNGHTGVQLHYSNDVYVGNNTIRMNYDGVRIHFSERSIWKYNNMSGNRYSFGVWGGPLAEFLHSIDTSNVVDGKVMYYLINKKNVIINPSTFPNLGFLGLVNSTDCLIEDLIINHNYQGVILAHTRNSILTNSTITYNEYGIYFFASPNNLISNNVVSNNIWGTFLTGVPYSSNNIFYHNSFVDNIFQRYTSGSYEAVCSWDNGYPFGGNYWSDYTGTDLGWGSYQNKTGSDGIGDTPYVIDDNNRDNYPLMSPYEYWSTPIPGDINKDMEVNSEDLSQIATAYGSTPEKLNWNPNGDINGDGKVDVLDLFGLGRNYEKTVQTMDAYAVEKLSSTTALRAFASISIMGVLVGKRKLSRKTQLKNSTRKVGRLNI